MKKTHKKQTYKFGIFAEKISILFLRLKGYKILAWRYKTKVGEIDIIAKKSNIIAIIEVKARAKKTLIEEIIRQKQINRIKRAAELFIARNSKYHNCAVRLDFIEVRKLFIKHHKNFFS